MWATVHTINHPPCYIHPAKYCEREREREGGREGGGGREREREGGRERESLVYDRTAAIVMCMHCHLPNVYTVCRYIILLSVH